MARTTSDIIIDAPAKRIMDVIADFGTYPDWATGVRAADIVAGSQSGRAERVRFILDAAPIRDEYELGYTWDGERAVSWSLTEPGKMLTSMDGMYVLEPVDKAHTKVTSWPSTCRSRCSACSSARPRRSSSTPHSKA